MLRLTALCAGLLLLANALALSPADLSQDGASSGLKDAPAQGAQITVRQFGQPDGFNNNSDVRIELPGKLDKAAKLIKRFSVGAQVDQLEVNMNRAVETVASQVQDLLVEAVKEMTVADARGILKSGGDAVAEYLDKLSREQLRAKLLSTVKQATDEIGLVKQYDAFASQAAVLGAVDVKSANIEGYVTEQALDGLFEVIAKQGKSIRQNPAVVATSLAKRVFGAAR